MIKEIYKKLIPQFFQDKISNRHERIRILSIKSALKEQGLLGLYNRLESVSPDISNQYSNVKIDSEYFKTKIRGEHAFQVSLVQEALRLLGLENKKSLTIIDIGDSCGTHLGYLKNIYKDIDTLSVNLDPVAVERIKKKGMKAVCADADDIDSYSLKGDVYLSFEMLEHLFNPAYFLYRLARKIEGETFIVTVPYIEQSRVGLHHIRNGRKNKVSCENVHIFELSPYDWKLIFQHSGWSVAYEKIYFQYTRKGFFRLMKGYWKKVDYEGFYGAVLKRDSSWSDLYKDWKL